MTRHALIALGGLTGAVAAAAIAVAVAPAAPDRTLTLAVSGTRLSEVDVPPLITGKHSPETPGDEVIGVSRVTGDARGTRYLFCQVVRQGPSIEAALYDCRVTYVLAGGTLVAAGVVSLERPAVVPVVGGTGRYAGAHGTLAGDPKGRDTIALQ